MTNKMPIKAEPFKHQKEAFNFAMKLYDDAKKRSRCGDVSRNGMWQNTYCNFCSWKIA